MVRTECRLLVVAASAVVRRAVAQSAERDPSFAVVETAGSGNVGWARSVQQPPDLVALDWDFPGDEAPAFLFRFRSEFPRVPVVVFSAEPQRVSAAACVPVVGAAAISIRPASAADIETWARSELIRWLKLAQPPEPLEGPVATDPARHTPLNRDDVGLDAERSEDTRRPSAHIVAIAASTGGPDALMTVLSGLPAAFRCPIVIGQHMPSGFTTTLAERLAARTGRRIREATQPTDLSASDVWIAPGGRHLEVRAFASAIRVCLTDEPPENGCRPAADVLFRSVAAVYGSRTLAVVLTGMGQDGLDGCRHVRAVDGQVLVQDQATCVIGTMPGSVRKAGLAEREYPISQIGLEIGRRCRSAEAEGVR